MPPALDIYCLTKRRDADTINSFLNRFVNRSENEEREDEELMIRKLDAPACSDREQDYEWELALTLSHAVQSDYLKCQVVTALKSVISPAVSGDCQG